MIVGHYTTIDRSNVQTHNTASFCLSRSVHHLTFWFSCPLKISFLRFITLNMALSFKQIIISTFWYFVSKNTCGIMVLAVLWVSTLQYSSEQLRKIGTLYQLVWIPNYPIWYNVPKWNKLFSQLFPVVLYGSSTVTFCTSWMTFIFHTWSMIIIWNMNAIKLVQNVIVSPSLAYTDVKIAFTCNFLSIFIDCSSNQHLWGVRLLLEIDY